MKHIILAALALSACTVQSAGSQAVTAADYIYASAEKTGEVLVRNGEMGKATFKTDAAKAYTVLLAVRAGNATVDDLIAAVAVLKGAKP